MYYGNSLTATVSFAKQTTTAPAATPTVTKKATTLSIAKKTFKKKATKKVTAILNSNGKAIKNKRPPSRSTAKHTLQKPTPKVLQQ